LPAQSPAPPSAITPSESKSKAEFSQEPAVLEYVHCSMRYENDGSGTRETRARIRVQTPAALTLAGQLVFQYTATDEEVEIESVRVIKPDGSVVTAGPDTVQDLSAPVTREAPMYTDARQKHVTVPGVSVGDAVEYDVVTMAKPLLPGQFWQIWNFESRVIALDEQLDLNVPSNRTLKIKSSEGMEPSISVEGDRRIYHWATSNLKTPPPIDLFKAFNFDVIKLLEGERPPSPPRVMFSTFQSWSDVADWYSQLEHDKRTPTPEIRAKADEITRGLETDEAKAEALYYWVSQNIRYVSLSFGVGRYQPHLAANVFANRYGDCKDKTTLLEAMLEAEGLHGQPVLANAVADVDPDVPNPLQFDHVFEFLHVGSKDVWLDTTLGVAPFGYLAPQLRGKESLVVSAMPSKELRKTPQELPLTVEYRVGVKGIVDAEGTLDATVELQSRGDLEVLIRLLNDHLSQDQLAKSADTVLARTNGFLYNSVQYTDFKVINGSDSSHPVKAQFHVSGKLMYVNPKDSTREQLTAALTTIPLTQLRVLNLLPKAESKPVPPENAESLPVDLKGPKSYSLDVELAFASLVGSEVPPPREFRITKDFAEYASLDSWKDNVYHGSKSLDLRVATVPSSDSKDYAAFAEKIFETMPKAIPAATKPVTVSGDSKPAHDSNATSAPRTSAVTKPVTVSGDSNSAHDPPSEAVDLYKQGQEESKRKNWASAIEAFGSAVKMDPQYPDAWRELGRAHMYARQYPDAEAAFRKYLQLAPDNHLAYLNIAWALYTEGKYQEDADLMEKRIAVAPTDGDALYRLGMAYLALDRPEPAVPVLERATVQFPKYVAAQFALGGAYLGTKQDARALEAFRVALKLDDSEGMLNNAAYTLSVHSSSLDVAESWSLRSIEVVEKELNDSSLSNVQSRTWGLVVQVGQYWDTMGWIKFQQGKMDAAEKYVHAAWQITDDLAIGLHLGRIYETQGRKNDAVQTYLAALVTVPADRLLNDDAKETRKRLSELLGSDSEADDRLSQSRKKKSSWRMVNIPNPGAALGIAQYTVMIDANSRVVEIAATSSDDPLAALNDAVRAATMPQSFPDPTLKKLPRLSTLACAAADQPCVFALVPASAASRLAPPTE